MSPCLPKPIRSRLLLALACAAWAGTAPPAMPAQKGGSAGQWHAPKSCLFLTNPVAATPLSIRAGAKIYQARCYGCHGAAGRGDGPDASQLSVHPARLSGRKVQEQSDGLLWWKITAGRRPMPGFGFRLSSVDRWNVINFLRSLSEEELRNEARPPRDGRGGRSAACYLTFSM